MSTEWGVRFRYATGREFVAAGYTHAGAAAMVTDCGKGFDPRPVAVVRREVGEWIEEEK